MKLLWAILACLLLVGCSPCLAETVPHYQYLGQFKATAYCSCKLCCGKSNGITASGKKASDGTIACNWLPFGTKLRIAQIKPNSKIKALWHEPIGIVLDRGAKSLFGSSHKHIKHIDLWMPSHAMAKKYGVQLVDVWIVDEPQAIKTQTNGMPLKSIPNSNVITGVSA